MKKILDFFFSLSHVRAICNLMFHMKLPQESDSPGVCPPSNPTLFLHLSCLSCHHVCLVLTPPAPSLRVRSNPPAFSKHEIKYRSESVCCLLKSFLTLLFQTLTVGGRGGRNRFGESLDMFDEILHLSWSQQLVLPFKAIKDLM